MSAADDIRHMRHAFRLSERALGTAAPNPAVGCVIVDAADHIVGRGWTRPGGRPHAEIVALEAAGALAKGATAYVTLEPCAHHGRTPPCAEALAAAGLARVVAAIEDPDPRVRGKGMEFLKQAGIETDVGLLASEAREINAGFFLRVEDGRPLVTLKIAQSLDGRTATSSGASRWITGPEARAMGHLLRARHDAILVGVGTALADDPELTCRIPGIAHRSPVRIVLDSRLRLNERMKLFQTAREVTTIVYTSAARNDALSVSGIEIVQVQRDARGRPDIGAVVRDLGARGITRLLVEGGAGIHAAFLDRGLADRLEIFTAATVLGGGGHAAIEALAAIGLDEVPRFRRTAIRSIGSDTLESYAAGA